MESNSARAIRLASPPLSPIHRRASHCTWGSSLPRRWTYHSSSRRSRCAIPTAPSPPVAATPTATPPLPPAPPWHLGQGQACPPLEMATVAGDQHPILREDDARYETVPHSDGAPCYLQGPANLGRTICRLAVEWDCGNGRKQIAHHTFLLGRPGASQEFKSADHCGP